MILVFLENILIFHVIIELNNLKFFYTLKWDTTI